MEARGSRGLLARLGAASDASDAGEVEPTIALGPDRGRAAGEEVGRGDVADRAVQTDGVVVLDPARDEGTRLVDVGGLTGADRVGLDGLVPALDLAVGLR